jgi:Na+/melibiose symporter-like transporter
MIGMIAVMILLFAHGLLIESFHYPNSTQIDYSFGYMVSALIIAPLLAFTRVITCTFVPETPYLPSDSRDTDDESRLFQNLPNESTTLTSPHQQSLWLGVRKFVLIWWTAMNRRDFALLALAWTLAWVVLSLVTSNIILYVTYYYRQPDLSFLVVLTLQTGIALSLPVWAYIIRFLGKRKSLFLGSVLLSIFFLPSFFLQPNHFYILLAISPLAGCAAGSLYICLSSMQPDCVEDYYHNTLQRHEGVLYSIFLLGGKIGSALALALSNYTLALTGYVSATEGSDIEQNEATLFAFRVMIFLVPLCLMLIICVVVFFIKDFKKDYSTDRATLSGYIISESVQKMIKSSNSSPEGSPLSSPMSRRNA